MGLNRNTQHVVLSGRHGEPVLVAMAYLFGQFLVLSMSEYFPGEHPLLFASIASTIVAATCAVLAVVWIDRSSGWRFTGRKNIPAAQYAICLCAGALAATTACFLVTVIPAPGPANPMLAKAFLDKGPEILIPWIASVVIAAPVGEEMVFRGAIQSHLASRIGNILAISTGALLFMLIHVAQLDGYWPAMVGIFGLGIVAGVARVLTESILGAILVHVAYNSTTMAVVLISNQ